MAAVALESLRLEDAWHPGATPDAIAFHRDSWLGATLAPALFKHRLERCTGIAGTRFMVCSREPLPPDVFGGLETQAVPALLAFTPHDRPTALVDPRGFVLRDRGKVDGVLGLLPRGAYVLTLALEAGPPAGTGAALAWLEIATGKTVLASAIASVEAPAGARELAIPFTADGSQELGFRVRSQVPSELVIIAARLQGP